MDKSAYELAVDALRVKFDIEGVNSENKGPRDFVESLETLAGTGEKGGGPGVL